MIRTGVLVLLLLLPIGDTVEAKSLTIVLFGDSNTSASNWKRHGYNPNETWANLLKAYYQEARIINAGVAGDTTEDARKRFVHDVVNKHPAIVFIMFGTNDAHLNRFSKANVDKKTFANNLVFFVDEIEKNNGKAVLMTCLPIVEGNGSDGYYYSRHPQPNYQHAGGAKAWHDSYNDIIRTIAEQKNIPLIDHWKIFVNFAGGADDRALIRSGLIDSSGYHVTPKGARLMAEEIIKL